MPSSSAPIVVGIAGMRRKLNSKPLQAMLRHLVALHPNMHIIILDDALMTSVPLNQWPKTDVLLTLYSANFPYHNVLRYIARHNPVLINNLRMQPTLMDRRLIRRVLKRSAIPVPPAIYFNRSNGDSLSQSPTDNYNTVTIFSPSRANTTYTMRKPFVEKPVNPEDHSKFTHSTHNPLPPTKHITHAAPVFHFFFLLLYNT